MRCLCINHAPENTADGSKNKFPNNTCSMVSVGSYLLHRRHPTPTAPTPHTHAKETKRKVADSSVPSFSDSSGETLARKLCSPFFGFKSQLNLQLLARFCSVTVLSRTYRDSGTETSSRQILQFYLLSYDEDKVGTRFLCPSMVQVAYPYSFSLTHYLENVF